MFSRDAIAAVGVLQARRDIDPLRSPPASTGRLYVDQHNCVLPNSTLYAEAVQQLLERMPDTRL